MIKKLYTEAQVSALLDLDPDIPLEDAVVKSYQTARVSGAVQELTVQPAMVTLTLPPIESINIVIPPVAAVLESTAKAPVSDLIEDLFNRPHYDTTYPQEGDADDTDNNSSNMQDEDLAGYGLKIPAIEIRKTPINHVLVNNNPSNMQEEDMAGYGLKVPAIETRKTPINHVLGNNNPLNMQEEQEEDMAGYGLKVPAIETKKTTEEDSKSSSSVDSSDYEWGEKCNEIIAVGDEIHYYHFMVVMGTPGAMSIGSVTAIDPGNDYMISVSTGDPIPRESKICRVRETNSSGDLVAISGKRKWRICESYQCEAALNDNALSNAVYAKSARLSGVFNAITNSLVQTGVPSDIFRRFSGPVPANMLVESPDNVGLADDCTNMLVESPDNVGLADDSWNGLFSSLKFDFQFDANPKMLWLYTISLSSKVTTKEDLVHATLRSRFAVVTRKEVTEPWIRVILEKVRNRTWNVLDEMGDDRIMTVDCTKDNGPIAEWDMLYKSPTEGNMRAAVRESQKKLQDQVTTDSQIDESPRRKAARNDACIYQKKVDDK